MDAVFPFVIVGAPIGVAIAITTSTLFAARACWGSEPLLLSAGEGAYRAGVTRREVPRRVPGPVAVGAIAATAWGAVTLFLLVPAGGLLALIALGGVASRGVLYAPYALVVVAAVISGAVHAASLFGASDALARRGGRSCAGARAAARHGRWHHAAIWLAFPLPVLAEGADAWAVAAAILALPCGVGLLVAQLVARAGRAIEHLDARDRAQSRISTGAPIASSTVS